MGSNEAGGWFALWVISLVAAYIAGWYKLRITVTKPTRQ